MSTTLRGARHDEPEMPTGRIQLQPPPEIEQAEGASGVLMNAIPMLGSLGSIVLVATHGRRASGGRSYIAAGMFLFATLGFIVVQLDRQRKQRTQQVTGSRTEYLRYLAGVRKVARESADQQRRALTWHHPEPAALPALAEERSRVWEHTTGDANFLHVRYGLCAQPLSVELVPPDSTPIDQVDPAAASALHRLLVVHRIQPNLPASIDLRAFDRHRGLRARGAGAVPGPRDGLLGGGVPLPRATSIVAVLCSEQNLAHWDWVKWLPHAQSAEQSDAVGPSRMVTTSLADLAALLPPDLSDRPRFGADERPADAAHPARHRRRPRCRPATTSSRPTACTASPCSTCRAAGTSSTTPSRLRLELEDPEVDPTRGRATGVADKVAIQALRVREDAGPGARRPVRPRHRRGVRAPARPAAHRLRPAERRRVRARSPGPTDFMDLLGLGDVHRFDPAAAWRPRPARDRLRVPIGLGEGGGAGPPRHQGVRPAGHGPARPGHRRDRLGQVGVPAHAGARAGDDPLPRAAQHGARRLQGRRDLRRDVASCRTSPR